KQASYDEYRYWDPESGEKLAPFSDLTGDNTALPYLSPNGRSRALSRDFEIRIHSATGSGSKAPEVLRGQTGRMHSLAWSPDNRRLVSRYEDGTAKVWDAAKGQELLTLRGRPRAAGLRALQFDPDGWRLAAAEGNTVRIWDARHSYPDMPDPRL